MKILVVTLALCAVCVAGEGIERHKRGWNQEPPTQPPGWGWHPPPPPPPPPTKGWGWQKPDPPKGWGWPQPQPTKGWGWEPPKSSGWGQSDNYYRGGDYGYGYGGGYNSQYGRYPRQWGRPRYGRYADDPYRSPFSAIRSPVARSSSYL